jgi:GrpB-like predicted nucleotidyltransferase (UPF0157 family)
VFSAGGQEIERMLRFRHWLRVNAADREIYARTKAALVREQWRGVQDYAAAKSGVIQEIMERARYYLVGKP